MYTQKPVIYLYRKNIVGIISKTAVLNRFQNMDRFYRAGPFQIGYGSRDFKNPVAGPARKTEFGCRQNKSFFGAF